MYKGDGGEVYRGEGGIVCEGDVGSMGENSRDLLALIVEALRSRGMFRSEEISKT